MFIDSVEIYPRINNKEETDNAFNLSISFSGGFLMFSGGGGVEKVQWYEMG